MKYYIGVDLGTSSIKLILCDALGNVQSSVSESYPISFPRPSWSEENPLDWWGAFVKGIRALTSDIDKSEISGIAVCGQMHGLVILDKGDEVIRPAILWNDARCDEETEYLNSEIGKKFLSEHTANIAFAGFTAPKLLWLQKNEPESFRRIEKIMLPKDYINYRLTGKHATDYSDASGMLFLDVENKCWSREMLDICGIEEKMLPTLYESYEKIGELLPDIATELGLPSGITVAGGAGDNAGAAIGTGTVGEGKCNISLGTSGTVFISSDSFSLDENNSLHSFCHADGKYHLMGCMLSCASANKWFCDNILKSDDYATLQAQIGDELLGNNGVYFLPYLMGERSPINDTDASGTFIGLRLGTTREEMLLAILEGVSFAIRDSIEVARKLGINVKESTVCGGGAKSGLWLRLLANILNITLLVPETEEGPGLGAVYLAISADRGEEVSQLPFKVNIRERVEPEAELSALYEKKYQKFKEIYPNIKKIFKIINE